MRDWLARLALRMLGFPHVEEDIRRLQALDAGTQQRVCPLANKNHIFPVCPYEPHHDDR